VRDAARAKVGGPGARFAPPAEAARGAEVVTLTVPYGALQATVGSLGDLAGKVVLDCTNPVGPGLAFAAPAGSSACQQVAQWARGRAW
jgi:predicted dinucleotide-binding enzyme